MQKPWLWAKGSIPPLDTSSELNQQDRPIPAPWPPSTSYGRGGRESVEDHTLRGSPQTLDG